MQKWNEGMCKEIRVFIQIYALHLTDVMVGDKYDLSQMQTCIGFRASKDLTIGRHFSLV